VSLFLLLKVIVASGFFFFVPGLPVALFVSTKLNRPWAALGLSPFFSIAGIFVSLYGLNFIGIRPNLMLFGLLLTLISAILTVLQLQQNRSLIRAAVWPLLSAVPAALLSIAVWLTSYANFNFAGPNQDAFNHNFWIARIAQVQSVLAADSRIDSPLQQLGSGQGFYPFAWHSAVAVAGSVVSVPLPMLSLASILVLWGVALPLGLFALAKEWAPEAKYLGFIAGVLVQLYPMVPGVPMSWGSMSSCAGIALLPISFFLVIVAMHRRDLFATAVAMVGFLVMIFVHTPEAATLGVLAVSVIPLFIAKIKFRTLIGLAGAALICIAPMLILFRSYIFVDTYPLRLLFGAVNPSWENALGSFVTMGVNVPIGPSMLSLLFLVGLVVASHRKYQMWMFTGIFGMLLVYLTAGAPSGVLTSLRIFTAPWYASYERTAWVAVPFVALISAVPLSALLERTASTKRLPHMFGIAAAFSMMLVVLNQQIDPLVTQFKKGPETSEVVGEADRPMLHRLKQSLKKDEIVFTFANDGSTYAFMYEGILTTSGLTYNRDGEESALIAALNRDIRSICTSPDARQAILQEKVGAFIFGDRLLGWGPPGWQPADIRSLPGLRVVDTGQHLTVAVPDLDSCQQSAFFDN
jgi:hypothetical protein